MTLRDLFTGPGKILEIELADLTPIADLALAAVLGVIAAGVALLQWRTHQRRVDSEERDRRVQRQYNLFDRRWKIYAGAREFLDAMSPMTRASTVAGKRAAEMYKTEEARRIRESVGFKMSVTTHTLGLAQQRT